MDNLFTIGHAAGESAEGRIYCHMCPRSYSDIYGLRKHINSIHGKDSKPVTCDLCTKTYKNKKSLQQHIRTSHTSLSGRRYPCRHCDKTFASVGSRNLHERIVCSLVDRPPVC